MLKSVFCFLILSISVNYASASCKVWEYAKLKDATKAELTKEYCYSTAMAELDGKLVKIARDGYAAGIYTEADIKGREGDQLSCLEQADETAAMLKKKFKSKAPENCPKR